MINDLEIDYISGYAPVQAEGRCGGCPFYFRAKGEQWEFYAAYRADADPLAVQPGADIVEEGFNDEAGMAITGTWLPEQIFQAGWMAHENAERIIRAACEILRTELNQRENPIEVDWYW